MFLGVSPNLPEQSLQHQDLHPLAIPPSILNPAHASGLRYFPRLHRRLRNMVSRQCLGKLRTSRQVLGPNSARLLFRQESLMVLELRHSHFHRSVDSVIPNARPQVSSAPQKTKVRLDGCFCSGWIVSILHQSPTIHQLISIVL